MGIKDKEWRPRLSVELTEDQFYKLQKNLPWGVKQTLFSLLVDEVNDLIDMYGPQVVGAIFAGKIALTVKEDKP